MDYTSTHHCENIAGIWYSKDCEYLSKSIGSDSFRIYLRLNGNSFECIRKNSDPIENTLNRLALKCIKKKNKKIRKLNMGNDSFTKISVHYFNLIHNYYTFNNASLSEQVLKLATYLNIENKKIPLLQSAPIVTKISDIYILREKLPCFIRMPSHLNFSKEHIEISWWCIPETEDQNQLLSCYMSHNSPYFISSSFCLVNPPNIENHNIVVTISHKSLRCFGFLHCFGKPLEGIEPSWRQNRLTIFRNENISQKHTHTNMTFSVASFNILAKAFTRKTINNDWFSYCSPKALDIYYRLPLIVDELLQLDVDILSLQECPEDDFYDIFVPILENQYTGHFTKKENRNDGCALFYKKDQFIECDFYQYHFKDDFIKCESLQTLITYIENAKPLFFKEILPNLKTIFQILVLTFNPKLDDLSKIHDIKPIILLIANTHLYFQPKASMIRLIQGYFLLNKISEIKKKYESNYNVSIILTGDYNSGLNSEIYTLLTKGKVSLNSSEWKSINFFSQEDKLNLLDSLTISDDSNNFDSFDFELYPNIKVFKDSHEMSSFRITNAVESFQDTLDYIMYSSNTLEVANILPMVPLDILLNEKGLPSSIYPSDHITIASNFIMLPEI